MQSPGLQWQLGPDPWRRRRTQQARLRPAGPAFKFGRSRYRAQPSLWPWYMVTLISVILCNIGNIM